MVTVACPSCGEHNPQGKHFCGDCGARLEIPCPVCHALNPPGKRFCGDCGNLLAGKAGPSVSPRSLAEVEPPVPALGVTDEERRLVTVLFADLVGFTSLAEQLDPEQVRELQTEYFGRMRAEIKRSGGTLDKYAGDAVLAIFGVPVAHEDDAERAVRCALGMQRAVESLVDEADRRWGIHLALRVGVNTGEVVSGTWDLEGRKDYAVSGDVVNTASRLQTAAGPGGVLVGAETMHLTQHCIRFGEPRELSVKGKARPVVAFAVLGLQDRVAERWEMVGHNTPLVGRQQEVQLLLALWERARESEGQLVTLVGDVGVGKSRLVVEVVERIQATGEVRVLGGRCYGHGQQTSLWLIGDLLRSLCGVSLQDGPAQVQSLLRTTLEDLLREQDEATRAAAIDVLGEILGLPPGNSVVAGASAQVRRQVLLRSLRLLLSATARTPALLVLQDLHWIDQASSEVLGDTLADVPGHRLMVLVTQRPGWSAPWNEWSWPERVSVRPLAESDAAVLAGAVLGGTTLAPRLQRYLTDRAGGNPFFVEEVVRALQEAGDLVPVDGKMELAPGAAERLPTTLTEILLARLDRLEGQVRNLAQVASVIGRQFAIGLLAQVVGRETTALEMPLVKLQQAEIAFPRRGTEYEYAFKHALLRDVAYTTLLHKRRQALHAATARAMASLYGEDEGIEIIAYHFSKTEEHMEAATWLEQAGDQAATKYDNQAALERYEEARQRLASAGADETALARIDTKRGRILHTLGRHDEALAVLHGAAETHRQAGDLEATAQTMAQAGWVHMIRATPEEGIDRIQQTLTSLGQSEPSHGLAALHVSLEALQQLSGRFDEALETSRRAEELASAVGDAALQARAKTYRGLMFLKLGRHQDALRELQEAIPLAEQTHDPDILCPSLTFLGEVYLHEGDLVQSRDHYQRGLALAETIGDTSWAAMTRAILGFISSHLGDWGAARQHLEQADATTTSRLHAVFPPRWLAQLSLAEGKWDETHGHLQRAIELSREAPSRIFRYLRGPESVLAEWSLLGGPREPHEQLQRLADGAGDQARTDAQPPTAHLPYLAWTHLERGEADRAEELARRAVEQATQEHFPLALADALRVQGMALAEMGRSSEAARSLEEAVAQARTIRDPYAEGRALYELGVLSHREGDRAQAQQQLEAALGIFDRLGAQPYKQRTQQALAELHPA